MRLAVHLVCGGLLLLSFVSTAAAQYDYSDVLGKAILFYEAQRSGPLPSSNRLPWRGDSALNDAPIEATGQVLDLTGGYYDAGDLIKFGLPMAQSMTTLALGLIEFEDGYVAAGQLGYGRAALKWGTDYFLKCLSGTTPETVQFVGQVGNVDQDHNNYWGRPEDLPDTFFRPAYILNAANPGADLAGETAAALAAAAIVFETSDPSYATQCLNAATLLYQFAVQYPGLYSDSITDAQGPYTSRGYTDELAWAAAWLYRATNDNAYLTAALQNNLDQGWGFSWDEKNAGVHVLLAAITQDQTSLSKANQYFADWLPGGALTYTPLGLAWRLQWGSLRYAANTAFLALVHSKHVDDQAWSNTLRTWAQGQIGYMLGDTGRSFVVGYGVNPPQQPHHKAASCPDRLDSNGNYQPCSWEALSNPNPNPQVLTGALVGGPGSNDQYVDNRQDYIANEVACDYNAGFAGALAALVSTDGTPSTQDTTTDSGNPSSSTTTSTTTTTTAGSADCGFVLDELVTSSWNSGFVIDGLNVGNGNTIKLTWNAPRSIVNVWNAATQSGTGASQSIVLLQTAGSVFGFQAGGGAYPGVSSIEINGQECLAVTTTAATTAAPATTTAAPATTTAAPATTTAAPATTTAALVTTSENQCPFTVEVYLFGDHSFAARVYGSGDIALAWQAATDGTLPKVVHSLSSQASVGSSSVSLSSSSSSSDVAVMVTGSYNGVASASHNAVACSAQPHVHVGGQGQIS
eukprot:m.148852 g.148852  ORF g.148852 m.148852 type:complete len:745 (-) comp17329_c0_seq2:70-2304(-)